MPPRLSCRLDSPERPGLVLGARGDTKGPGHSLRPGAGLPAPNHRLKEEVVTLEGEPLTKKKEARHYGIHAPGEGDGWPG